jgi:glycosyltransferase involved in cell wall biosynthesis
MTGAGPRVSIGMPVYNAQRYLAGTLDSILGQTFRDFELVISDNGSSDRTEQICREYASRDGRIRYYRNDVNRGAAWNHNRVLDLSRGEYFKWNSYDDRLAPEFLEKCVDILDRAPEVVLCFSKFVDVDGSGKSSRPRNPVGVGLLRAHERFRELIRYGNSCEEVYGVIRMGVLRKTPAIAPYAASDKVLLGELGLHGAFAAVPEVLFFHGYMHGDNMWMRHPDARDQHVWFVPAHRGRRVFPHVRMFQEYLKVLRRVEIRFSERVLCYLHLMPWIWQFRKRLFEDFSKPIHASTISFAKTYCPWLRTPWRKWKALLEYFS